MPYGEVMQQPSLDTIYRALSDPSRRTMIRQLAQGRSLSVGELAAPLPIALPTVLKHIGVLVQAGLVERVKSGRVVTVTLRPQPLGQALAWLEKTEAFWSTRLARLAEVAARDRP